LKNSRFFDEKHDKLNNDRTIRKFGDNVMKIRKIFAIVSYILTSVIFIICALMYLFGSFFLTAEQNYADSNDYQTYTIIVNDIDFDDDSIYISDDQDGIHYYLDGQNYLIATSNGILTSLSANDQITITIGKKGWGDSWDCPIVMLEKDETIFLDYETGVSNLYARVTELKDAFYKSLILPVGLLVVASATSLYFLMTKNKRY